MSFVSLILSHIEVIFWYKGRSYFYIFSNTCIKYFSSFFFNLLTDSKSMIITDDGLLKTERSFDHETENKIDMYIQACDHGSPPR